MTACERCCTGSGGHYRCHEHRVEGRPSSFGFFRLYLHRYGSLDLRTEGFEIEHFIDTKVFLEIFFAPETAQKTIRALIEEKRRLGVGFAVEYRHV